MKIAVNGKEQAIAEGATIRKLLSELRMEHSFLAVAVNMDFVAKSDYDSVLLNEGDEVEIVSPQAGG